MKMIIGGEKVDSFDGKTMDVINPATGEWLDTVPGATKEDVEKALDIAQEGKRIWASTPLHERSRILSEYANLVSKHRNEIATLLCKETGKPIKQAKAEVSSVSYLFRGFIERARHLYGMSMPDTDPGTEKDIVFTRREPLGVVACIIPFNYPAFTFAFKVAPALIMGNAVIVKPASDNPLNNIYLTELLLEAGVPGSVVQVITGSGPVVGQYLTASPKIDAVSLTGSTDVGIDTAVNAAKHLHHTFLELSGNDGMIIFEDADLKLAAKEAVQSRITNAGQVCIATKRLIVQNSVKEEFTNILVEQLKQIRIGDPLDPQNHMGCLINEKAAMKVEEQVQHTIAQGARCIYGGKRFNKTFFEPTVLVDVRPDMDVAKDMEIFGPVFPIIGFDTFEEAIAIHNASKYGLNGAVMTRDINKAMKTAALMECGEVVMNGSGFYRTMDIAFGGYKMSGLGREGISSTLEELSQVKTIVLKGVLG